MKPLKRAVKHQSTHHPPQKLSKVKTTWIKEPPRQIVQDRHLQVWRDWRKQFGLLKDGEGLWRCGSRPQHTNTSPLSTKHPIILPRDDHFTTLKMISTQEKVCHNGTKETWTKRENPGEGYPQLQLSVDATNALFIQLHHPPLPKY